MTQDPRTLAVPSATQGAELRASPGGKEASAAPAKRCLTSARSLTLALMRDAAEQWAEPDDEFVALSLTVAALLKRSADLLERDLDLAESAAGASSATRRLLAAAVEPAGDDLLPRSVSSPAGDPILASKASETPDTRPAESKDAPSALDADLPPEASAKGGALTPGVAEAQASPGVGGSPVSMADIKALGGPTDEIADMGGQCETWPIDPGERVRLILEGDRAEPFECSRCRYDRKLDPPPRFQTSEGLTYHVRLEHLSRERITCTACGEQWVEMGSYHTSCPGCGGKVAENGRIRSNPEPLKEAAE